MTTINEQSEEMAKLHENNITDLELILTTMEDLTTKQGDKISIQRVGITVLREVIYYTARENQ